VALGRGDHRLEQRSVCLLHLSPATELCFSLSQPRRETVANPLQVTDVEHSRAPRGPHRPLDSRARKRRPEQLAESLLEQRDLAAKVLADPALGEGVGLSRAGKGNRNALRVRDRLIGRLDLGQSVGHEASFSEIDDLPL